MDHVEIGTISLNIIYLWNNLPLFKIKKGIPKRLKESI